VRDNRLKILSQYSDQDILHLIFYNSLPDNRLKILSQYSVQKQII